MGHCKVKWSLYNVSQVWWGLHRGLRKAGQLVCGGCGFAGLWSCPEEEAALGNHSAQSPANV